MKLFNLFNWVTNLVEAFTFYGGGGNSGGGGGGNTTSTSYSTNLPEYAKPYYEELLKQTGKQTFATDASGNVTGVQPMPTYTGDRIAGFTPEQSALQAQVGALKTPGQFGAADVGLTAGQTMGYGAAGAGLGKALSYDPSKTPVFGSGAAAAYMSPYASNVTDIAVREAEKQRDMAKSAGALSSIGRGTFGGARQALLQAEQGRGAAQNIADIRAKGQQDAYLNAQQQFNADVQRQQQAQQYGAALGKDVGLAGLASTLEASKSLGALGATEQQANLERLKAQAATAEEKQAYNQQIKDLEYQKFQESQNYQRSLLEYYSNILRGNAGALGSSQVQYTPSPSVASQVGGLGLAGLGLYNLLGKG
jgi:hypothetical protein